MSAKKAKQTEETTALHMTVHRRNKSPLYHAAVIATEATRVRRSAVAVRHVDLDSRAVVHAEAEEAVRVVAVEVADSPTANRNPIY